MQLKRRLFGMTIGLSVVLASTVLAGASANAAAPGPSFNPLPLVQQQGLLAATAATPSTNLSAAAGGASSKSAAVPSTTTSVSITPAAENSTALAAPAGVGILVSNTNKFGFVTGTNPQGTNSSYVVIDSATAPSTYNFTIGAPGANLRLQTTSSGAISVTDANGNFVNFILPAWATDSSGASLPTSYTVNGDVITQRVDVSTAVFPVVADPSLGCGVLWCSVYFNKSETKDWATAGIVALGGAVAACGLAGPYAVVACAVGAAAIGATAIYAENHKECVGIIFYGVPDTPLSSWNPFAYTGKQCK
jgi:hypothetical protein